MTISNPSQWNFDIDRYLNRIIPPPPWQSIPYPVAWILGHRKDKQHEVGNIVMILWAVIGIFCSIIFIELASRHIPSVEQSGLLIVASFGAAAVLEFYCIESPLAQPRNAIFGQLIASTTGVGICKLFVLSPHFDSIRWLGGALSCAAATAIMAITKTVHPPAGATALLAVVENTAVELGWMLIPLMVLGCVIMLGTALVVNNIQRRFPSYWWTPDHLSVKGPSVMKDVEMGPTSGDEDTIFGGDIRIEILSGRVTVPQHIFLTPEERFILEAISDRI